MMKDLITSILLIGLAVFVYGYSESFADRNASIASNPALYPQILSIVLAGFGAGLLVIALKQNGLQFRKMAVSPVTYKMIKLFLILLLYVVAMKLLGFLSSTVICLFLFMVLLGSAKRKSAVSSVSIALVLYAVFSWLFNVPLPQGWLL